ncbi:MAG: hypothetical protein ACHQXA_00760 [Gemmatimonadales bacterium]
MSGLTIAGLLFLALAGLFALLARRALRHRRPLSTVTRGLLALLFFSFAAIAGLIVLGTRGYRALTAEEVAATVQVHPTGDHRFSAAFSFPDASTATYEIAGDQLYLDARILKWHYWADLLGFRTLYALDRVGGRYAELDDELHQPRTLYHLGASRPVDLFTLIRKYSFLAPFADAEYGSGTFLDVKEPAALEVRVSTTGLLLRRVGR